MSVKLIKPNMCETGFVHDRQVEFLIDSNADLDLLPKDVAVGSVAWTTDMSKQFRMSPNKEWKEVESSGGSGLPTGGAPNQQLVTDSDGVAKWEERLCYSDKTVIEWDGVIGDGVTNTGAMEGSFVKVSDLTPQLSDVVCGTALYRVNQNGVLLGEALITVSNAVYSGDDAWICACIDESGQGVSGGYLACALVDGANGMLDGQTLVFPEAGVYVVHIVVPSENVEMLIAKLEYGNVKPLDKAFIPPLSYAPYVEWQSAVMSVAATKPLTAGTILNWIKGIKLVYDVEEDCFYVYEFSSNARYKYTISDGKWVESLRESVDG